MNDTTKNNLERGIHLAQVLIAEIEGGDEEQISRHEPYLYVSVLKDDQPEHEFEIRITFPSEPMPQA